MGEESAISWTDHTFNPWHGCWKIADECKHCYAENVAVTRFGRQIWGRTAPRHFFGDKHWNEPRKWNRRAGERGVRERVFVGSMCDWAERHAVPEIAAQQDAARAQLWQLIRECQSLDWLLLTKRIEDAAELLPWVRRRCTRDTDGDGNCPWHPEGCNKPWPHVWLGGTAGTVPSLRRVAPVLRSIPAAVRFISGEPLLEHIPREEWNKALDSRASEVRAGRLIHWLIIGDESGHERRPAQADWVRTAREAAIAMGVRFHFKQWNGPEGGGISGRLGKNRKIHLPILDGRRWAEFPKGATEQ